MKAIQAYLNGYKTAWKSKKMISLIYIFYFSIALLIAIPFYRLFNSIAGNSLLPDNLISEFDMTAMADLIRDGGKVFMVYLQGAWPWLIAFVLLGTWMMGGILHWISAARGSFNTGNFLSACNKYFWPFFRVTIYSLILQIIVAFLIYVVPVILVSKDGVSDQYVVRTFVTAILLHLIFFILVGLMADFTRFNIFYEGKRKVLKMGWRSVKFTIRKIFPLYFIYLIWMLVPVILIVGYTWLRTSIQVDSVAMIIILFVIQQLFIWLRYFTRIQRLAMYYQFFIANQSKD